MKLRKLNHTYAKKGITIGAIVTGAAMIGVTFGLSGHVGFRPHKNDNLKFVKNEVRFPEEENSVNDGKDEDNSAENRDLSEHDTESDEEEQNVTPANRVNPLEDTRQINNLNNVNLDALGNEGNQGVLISNGAPSATVTTTNQTDTSTLDNQKSGGTDAVREAADGRNEGDTGSEKDDTGNTGGGNAQNQTGEGGETPSTQPVLDPDIKPEMHPALQEPMHYEEIPEQGIGDVSEDAEISLNVAPGNSYFTQYMKFYVGEKLEDWKILYAYDVELFIGKQVYLFTDENNKNLKIEGYPSVAEDDFEVVFSVRLNENSEWIRSEPQKVHVYAQKIVYKTQSGKEIKAQYAEEGQKINLYQNYEDELISESERTGKHYIFTGWSESIGGKNLGEYYTTARGYKALYLRPFTVVPDGMNVGIESEYITEDASDNGYVRFSQTLRGAQDQKVFRVPYGIQNISGTIEYDERGNKIVTPVSFKTDVLQIPETVEKMNLSEVVVRERYHLEAGNQKFMVNHDGLLLSANGEVLIGVPQNLDTVVIPESVTDIRCSFGMEKEQKVIITSRQVPEFDFNHQVHKARIYVSDESYYDYVTKWHPNESTRTQIRTEDGIVSDGVFVDSDGAILRKGEDGTICLHRIPDTGKDYYIVSDKVSVISQDVLDKCEKLEELYIPKSVKKIEEHAIDTDKVSHIQFMGEFPDMTNESFYGEELPEIRLMETMSESFIPKWEQLFGSESAKQIVLVNDYMLRTDEDFIYAVFCDEGEKKAALIEAPKHIKSFTEKEHYIPDDMKMIYIGEHAFDNCVNLKVVELPEDTKVISASAFSGCVNLEGFLSKATDEIFVGENVFTDAANLRFVAFNSNQIEFENPDEVAAISYQARYSVFDKAIYSLYLPNTAETIIDEANYFAEGYEIIDAGDTGKMLVCQTDENYVVIAATSDTSGVVKLPENTVQICTLAFSSIYQPFSIDAESFSSVLFISSGAFLDARGFEGNTDERGVLSLPEHIYLLEEDVFVGCYGLTKVLIGINSYIDESICISIPDNCFYDCVNLSEAIFEEDSNIQFIGYCAFSGTAIRYFEIPETVTELGFTPFSVMTEYIDFAGTHFPNLPDGILDTPFNFNYDTSIFDDTDTAKQVTILFHGRTAQEEPELAAKLIETWKYALYGFNNTIGEYESQEEEMFAAIYWMNFENYCDENYEITEENEALLQKETRQKMDEYLSKSEKLIRIRLGLEKDMEEDFDNIEFEEETEFED